MTDRELMQQALEALKFLSCGDEDDEELIKALRERLSQPEQEPVARVNDDGFIVETGLLISPGQLLYTAPPQRKPLTDEELRSLADKHLFYQPEGYEVSGVFTLARAIEAAHGIINPSSQDRNP